MGRIADRLYFGPPKSVQELVLVGPVLTGMPYTQHFLDRGKDAFALLQKNDVKGAIAESSNDKYLIGSQNEAARRKLMDLLTASPQDMTHEAHDMIMTPKPAIGKLGQFKARIIYHYRRG